MAISKYNNFSISNDKFYLSNFYPCDINYEGITYPSTEHAYQAAKSLKLEDRELIRDAKTCKVAKSLGFKVELRPGWDQIKYFVMLDILRIKFLYPDIAMKLMQELDDELVEYNYWHDNFWGICTCQRCSDNSVGLNSLGKILIQVKGELLNGTLRSSDPR